MPKRNRPYFALECESCHNRNYMTSKNPKNTTERLVLQKFCNHEQKHTAHKESK
ncbi:50S ribosomal protein L33 [Candidatus Parcubacteria bacterium]|nr:50S ribosomal protein L33 [Candidatus Parcubacteria bacterium]